MSEKRFITVQDGKGKKIYEGEDKRLYSSDYPKCAMGIPIAEWMKVGGFALGFVVMFTTMRIDIADIKRNNIKFLEYIENHDTWDTSQYNVRFKNGEPVDSNFHHNQGYLKG